jgi:hypothetical protein
MTDAYFPLVKTASGFDLGVTGTAGASKIVTAQVVGTFQPGDRFNLRLGESNYGFKAKPEPPVSALLTLGKKLYATSDTLLHFSAIDQPRNWDSEFGVGAGFINMFNEFSGAEKLRGMAGYAGRLAIFGRRAVSIWSMDVDPSRNSQTQVLGHIGALAPRSIVQVGDVDVFFLADSGVRSLRSRDINNIAFSADIGNPIDELVIADIRALGTAADGALGLIEPSDGRYWLIMGGKVYVFSHFSSAGIAAWSTYEPGFEIVDAATYDGRVWLRSTTGDVYLYGGDDNATYDDCYVEGELPFLSAGGPATMKAFTAFDAVCEGDWWFELGTNPEQPDARDTIGMLHAPSFDMARIPVNANGTHFSIRFYIEGAGYARLSSIIIHYTSNEAG